MAENPKARGGHTVELGRARFSVLSERMIRIEWSEGGQFEDRATLAVRNRRLPKVDFEHEISGDTLRIRTSHLDLHYRDTGRPFSSRNLSAKFDLSGRRRGRWHFGMKDRRNLGGTIRTLDLTDGNRRLASASPSGSEETLDLGQGFLSRSGWSLIDDSRGVVLDPRAGCDATWVSQRPEGRRIDAYLLAHGLDYRGALFDAGRVFGHQPLPPRFVLGNWYSRYWAYTDREIEALVHEFDSQSIPLDVMVIDMDWHLPGWTGYTWDRRYFPDPPELLRWLASRDVAVTLNLHPATGVGRHEEAFEAMCRSLGHDPKKTESIPFDCTDPDFMKSYFRLLHHPQERDGVDFWWMDWQQGEATKLAGLDPLPWINELHWRDQEQRRPERRPLNFSRYGGIGSGRQPIGFSGDTVSSWESLAFQPYFTATASNVLFGLWSHDIGGHIQHGAVDPELYTRWVQFGIHSPIFRTHATKHLQGERRVWTFPEPFGPAMSDAIRQRYELVPYIDGQLHDASNSGVSLLRPMAYDHPEREDAYLARDQYMFGNDMLVAPVTRPRDEGDSMAEARVWLPRGSWIDTAHGQRVRGGWHERRYLIDEIPVFVRPGAVIPGQRDALRLLPGSHPKLLFTIHPGDEGEGWLIEDDGVSTGYRNRELVRLRLSHRRTRAGITIRMHPARGDFKGFLRRRPVELRLPGRTPPRSIDIDGKTLPWRHRLDERSAWSYRADTATIVIRIARVDLRKGSRIRVDSETRQRLPSPDGLAGSFRRLAEVCRLVNLVSPAFELHRDERLAVDAYQTANRINRQPDRYAEELRRLARTLERLPEAIEAFADAYHPILDPDAERRGILAQAGRILASTLQQFPR